MESGSERDVTLTLAKRVVMWWLCTAREMSVRVEGGEEGRTHIGGRVDGYHPFVGMGWGEACASFCWDGE